MPQQIAPPEAPSTIPPIDHEEGWAYTTRFVEKVGAPTYQGRRIIGRDSRIEGGVYAGTYGGEALVVDRKKYSDSFDRLESEVESRIREELHTDPTAKRKGLLLPAVYETVRDKMPYSQAGVEAVNRAQNISDGDKIALNDYIDAKVGVCRHQALTVGALLESYIDKGDLRGQVSIDRSQTWSPNGEASGHAWVRYTTSRGTIYIIDVAQGYIGELTDRSIEHGGWNYLRPEEQRARALAASAGTTVLTQETVTKPTLITEVPFDITPRNT